jgi:signal transduction histidine kinase
MTERGIDWKMREDILQGLGKMGLPLSPESLDQVVHFLQDEIATPGIQDLIEKVEAVLDIDPGLSEREILRVLARNVVDYLGADFAWIWIYDTHWEEKGSLGDSAGREEERQRAIPFAHRIAREVLQTNQSYLVSNLSQDPKYDMIALAEELGIHSMLAVPLVLPRFSAKDSDRKGIIQIFYKEANKIFTPLEVQIAELLSRRVGYVIARKRILTLQQLNTTRNRILEEIFQHLSRREGIKMKEVFNAVIPELAHLMAIQRCALFSVTEDREHVVLEAGFPEAMHGIGKILSAEETYLQRLVHQTGPFGDFEHEIVHPSYILIRHPRESRLLPAHLKDFLALQQINSVLYIPLKGDDIVQYILAFDAQAQHTRFAQEEIEMLTVFGKEMAKALKLEKMDDILHDIKNPAIAIAGFSKRIKKLLPPTNLGQQQDKIKFALDLLIEESSRIEELILSIYEEGTANLVDLSEVLQKRFLLNQEVIQELQRANIRFVVGHLESPLTVKGYPLHMERVFDNLLNNATHAIPEEGGELSICTAQEGPWAIAKISNTGEMAEKEKIAILMETARGRGLHITNRLIKQMKGKLEVESEGGKITFRVQLPLVTS